MQQLSRMKKKWVNINHTYDKFLEISFITTFCLAFVLSDWMLGIFSFSDYVFGILFLMMAVSNNFKIRPKQYKWIIIILSILLFNILQNYIINDSFILKIGVAGFLKIATYTIVIIGLYNFFEYHKSEKRLINSMNVTAVIVCLIGFYISIALYFDGYLPYEFFWHYTRTDAISYLFEGSDNLYRLRSIFSEPSYLGYYLNIILGINIFNKKKIKANNYFILLLILTIILTFSYSSIAIMGLTLLLKCFSTETFRYIKQKKVNYIYLLAIIVILGVMFFVTKDIIQVTLIDRTLDIINGKDSSASSRLLESWQYINKENLISGNGIGHTPDIWNIYAYFLSDLGLIAFVALVLLSGYLVKKNYKIGILFIALNFQKGGYLSAPFYIFLLLIFLYAYEKRSDRRL